MVRDESFGEIHKLFGCNIPVLVGVNVVELGNLPLHSNGRNRSFKAFDLISLRGFVEERHRVFNGSRGLLGSPEENVCNLSSNDLVLGR